MTTTQKLFLPLAFFLAFTLVFSSFTLSASADHSEDEEVVSQATTVHDDEDEDHDDHGIETAIASTDVAQLKAYIALLTQLIELLNKQVALKASGAEAHTDDHDDDHHDDDTDESNDDEDEEDESEDEHEEDSDDDHDED